MKEKVIATAAIALAIAACSGPEKGSASSPPAAPPKTEGPGIGSSCKSSQLNQTTMSSTGKTVRCLSNEEQGYIWMIDTGVKQERWIADQLAWAACHKQGHSDAECRAILNS